MSFSKGQPVWWEPPSDDRLWHKLFPKRQKMACNIISVNEGQGTALVEYMDATRRTHERLAQLDHLQSRALPR